MANPQESNVIESFSLRNRVAIITGAGGHLGAAMARALAEAGARVIATSRDAQRAEAVASSLPDPHFVRHLGVALDQIDSASIDRCIESVIQATGRIDVLVNNAHDPIKADWTDVTAEQFNRQLSNATGYFLLARHVRNHAVEQGRPASVVMIGSMYGLVGSYPDSYEELCPASPAAYHALKGSILQLTHHLAVYWAKDDIRVNCLSPGPFPSPKIDQRLVDRLNAKSPLRRMGAPHELKGPLLLLASDAGSYITGQNLVVDGGWTAW